MRVLILDDDTAFLSSMGEAIERLRYDALPFRRWIEALECVDRPDAIHALVVALELDQGGPNAVSFARMAKHRHPGLKIVFVTLSKTLGERVDSRLGVVVLKAIEPSAIAAAVDAALRPPAASAVSDRQDRLGSEEQPSQA